MPARKLKLLFIYNRGYLLYAALMTLLSYYMYFSNGNSALMLVIWFKVITSGIGVFAYYKRKSQEVFFYLNNGFGKQELIAISWSLDLLLWLIGMVIIVR